MKMPTSALASNRKLVLGAVGASFLVAVVWYLLLWSPQSGQLDDAQTRVTTAGITNDQLELRLARLSAANAKAAVLHADFDRLEQAVPDEPELAQFILDANQAATDSGVEFLAIAPGVPEQTDPALPPAISLAITVKGGYFEALDYLDKMSGLPRVVVVDTLTLTPGGDQTSSGLDAQDLTISVNARMFTTTLPAVAAPLITTTTTVPDPSATTTTVAP
jgi:Tfp pilus assembly protein PilO